MFLKDITSQTEGPSPRLVFDDKGKAKKKVYEAASYTYKGFSKGS